MTRSLTLRLGIAIPVMMLASCAILNGVPQTPCQRAIRAADTAHAAVNVAVVAGADPIVIAKLNTAADAAQVAAAAVCAVAP